jgi:AraC-like DNA-binding protein
MDNELFSKTIPAKLQSYMACGMPIIAAAKGETEKIIKDANCGVCSDIGDADSLAELIVELISDESTESLGENAKAYFDQLLELTKSPTVSKNTHFSIAECVHKIIHTVATERLAEKTDEYRIREALNASVYDKLSLEDLAAKLHISKSNVIRVFKKSYGVTPYEYLLTLKIATAKLLLRDTKMTVKEISDRLHISDEHYFSSLFLARVGMRPKDYRNKKR